MDGLFYTMQTSKIGYSWTKKILLPRRNHPRARAAKPVCAQGCLCQNTSRQMFSGKHPMKCCGKFFGGLRLGNRRNRFQSESVPHPWNGSAEHPLAVSRFGLLAGIRWSFCPPSDGRPSFIKLPNIVANYDIRATTGSELENLLPHTFPNSLYKVHLFRFRRFCGSAAIISSSYCGDWQSTVPGHQPSSRGFDFLSDYLALCVLHTLA
jgi:hypothetical protein